MPVSVRSQANIKDTPTKLLIEIGGATMKETVIQFGEGNFLRGFVDNFLDILNKQGLYDGKAVIIQPRPGGKVKRLQDQDCRYHLFLRGIREGEPVVEQSLVESVARCIDPYVDFESFRALAADPAFRFVVSNTTEAGIAFVENCRLEDTPCLSFPGKVTQLLYWRYQLGLSGFVFLPCELIDANGDALKSCVLRYAEVWNLEPAFTAWVEKENVFANTLVDRIVTGYPASEKDEILRKIGFDDPCLNTAETFALWVIEGNFEEELPLVKAGIPVIWTDDASPYKKRKVRVLNGAHTSTVFPALLCGVDTVRQAMDDKLISAFLKHNLFEYILPMLGETQENLDFAQAVLDRFANPYIQHQWKAISLNSVSKFKVRVLPTMLEYRKEKGIWPRSLVFSLACLLKYYKEQPVSDDAATVETIRSREPEQILADRNLWGVDLSGMTDVMNECWDKLQRYAIREAVQWAIS